MLKYIYTFLLLTSSSIAFCQNTTPAIVKESIPTNNKNLGALKETPNGLEYTSPKVSRVLNLDSGIALHPNDIVSDEVIAQQIKSIEEAILVSKNDEPKLTQLNKELINLVAKRKYLKDNNLN